MLGFAAGRVSAACSPASEAIGRTMESGIDFMGSIMEIVSAIAKELNRPVGFACTHPRWTGR